MNSFLICAFTEFKTPDFFRASFKLTFSCFNVCVSNSTLQFDRDIWSVAIIASTPFAQEHHAVMDEICHMHEPHLVLASSLSTMFLKTTVSRSRSTVRFLMGVTYDRTYGKASGNDTHGCSWLGFPLLLATSRFPLQLPPHEAEKVSVVFPALVKKFVKVSM
jgi:hypothetical protein